MAATAVMTLRIAPELLAALRTRAVEEGRSVSAEVVRLIRREVEPKAAQGRRKPGWGMFAKHASVDIQDVRALRRSVSDRWKRAQRKKAAR